jgi:hypothetical protein
MPERDGYIPGVPCWGMRAEMDAGRNMCGYLPFGLGAEATTYSKAKSVS